MRRVALTLTLGSWLISAACGQTQQDPPKEDAAAGGSGGSSGTAPTGGSAGDAATGGASGGTGPTPVEACANGVDDDKNGKTDCQDPDCFAGCGCALNEDCTNGKDDDCDGLADCKDLGCGADPCCSGAVPKAESCAGGKDDDCDGKIDCADPDCAADACCGDASTAPEACANGKDDDCDGKTDCADPDCASSACGCIQPADCAIPTNVCLERTCQGGVCGTKPALGKPLFLADPTPGDCRTPVCGPDGALYESLNDGDAPFKIGPCYEPHCFDGSIQGWAKEDGTPCGSGLSCKRDSPSSWSTSQCVGCQDASTCPLGDDCKAAKCSSGKCGYAFVPAGNLTSANVAHDCRVHVCNGKGSAIWQADDSDSPDDGNPCTFDSCTNGNASFENAPAGTACGAGKVCDGGGNCGP
ncbi:MAG: hypothetical protein IPM35_37800 [Myxococcales bacterium]|nr:hypothetical protein [Myxococcales bacterium]